MLRRLGNKSKLAAQICKLFPAHTVYIEPFFGAGGMLFNKQPIAKYNYLNDLDQEVFNLYSVLKSNKAQLTKHIQSTPYDKTTFAHLKTTKPKNNIEQAARFVILSNYGLFGQDTTLRFGTENAKKTLLQSIDKVYNFITQNHFQFNTNKDWKAFITNFHLTKTINPKNILVYADPPYVATKGNYVGFTAAQRTELLRWASKSPYNVAISEFATPELTKECAKLKLHITTIGERRTLGNRNTEILITNYKPQKNAH